MPFEKGKSGNPNGRPVGAINKSTAKFKELGAAMMNEDIDRLKSEMAKLEGKDYVDAYCKLIEFFAPKLSRQEVKSEVTNKHQPIQLTADEYRKMVEAENSSHT